MRKIRKRIESFDEEGLDVLVPFAPPVCETCNQEMKNVNTVEGKRRFQCMTWGCTNHRLYNQEGDLLGQNPSHSA